MKQALDAFESAVGEPLPDQALTGTQGSVLNAGDRTGPEFWDRWWQHTPSPLPAAIDPHRGGVRNYPFRSLHRYFGEVFRGEPTSEQRLIEIGCAQSVFLPYFAPAFGFHVAGLDQSELGCERARQILDREQVQGKVFAGDLFAPPSSLTGAFDAAVSFGVIEHFADTSHALRAVAEFLKPGGRIVTLIPNLTGALGRYQRLLDRAVFEAHVVMDREKLSRAHRDAGLVVESSDYLMFLDLRVLGAEVWKNRLAKKLVSRLNVAASRLVWRVDDHLVGLKPNRWTSPYVACAARKSTG